MIHEIKQKIEPLEKGWAKRITNNIIWGNSNFNPELITEHEKDLIDLQEYNEKEKAYE